MPWKTTSCSASTRKLGRELCSGGMCSCIWWKESQTPPNKQGSYAALFHTALVSASGDSPSADIKQPPRIFLNDISLTCDPMGLSAQIMNFNKHFRSRLSRSLQPVNLQLINLHLLLQNYLHFASYWEKVVSI